MFRDFLKTSCAVYLALNVFPANLTGPQVRWRPVFKIVVRLREIEAGSGAHVQGKAVEVLTTCH